MTLRSAACALVGVTALALTACTPGGSEASDTVDTINASITTDPTGFDPALARASDDYYVDRMLFDTLLRKDSDNTLVGGLATDWTATDASNYSFTLREGATCSDGTEITATVVANSLARFADPELKSPGRTLAMGPATATFTPDDAAGTVSVTLSAPWSDFLTGMTLPHTGIVCPAGLADTEGLLAGTVEGAFSGPYTVASSQPAVSYELALREDYDAWPEFAEPLTGTPAATVVFTPQSDESTTATQVLSGGLDIAFFRTEAADRITGEGYQTQTVSDSTSYLLFNQRAGSVFADNADLRRAVAAAVDQAALTDVLSGGLGETIQSVSPESVPFANTDASLLVADDPQGAAAVLAGTTIRLVGTVSTAPGSEYVAEVLRQAGATVEYSEQDTGTWSATTTQGEGWDMTIQADINVLGTLTSSLLRVMGPAAEDGGRNKVGVVNETGYAALQSALATVEESGREAGFTAAQESFLADVSADPVGTLPSVLVSAEGFSIRAFGTYIDPATMRISD